MFWCIAGSIQVGTRAQTTGKLRSGFYGLTAAAAIFGVNTFHAQEVLLLSVTCVELTRRRWLSAKPEVVDGYHLQSVRERTSGSFLRMASRCGSRTAARPRARQAFLWFGLLLRVDW